MTGHVLLGQHAERAAEDDQDQQKKEQHFGGKTATVLAGCWCGRQGECRCLRHRWKERIGNLVRFVEVNVCLWPMDQGMRCGGIVNLKKSLDEFSPLNLHLGALIGTLSKKFWVDAPLSYRIRRNYLCNCY